MPPKKNLLSNEQLQKIELILNTLSAINKIGVKNIAAVLKGDPKMCDVIVESIIIATDQVRMIMPYGTLNQFENKEIIKKQIEDLTTLDYKFTYSLKDLIEAKNRLNNIR